MLFRILFSQQIFDRGQAVSVMAEHSPGMWEVIGFLISGQIKQKALKFDEKMRFCLVLST